ncbi:MAG TPA: F0F1 ATP synthase subunit epsilon [Symbiobacteriaceae bacterium]|nr:F0F1 ATP synthase subunit epsilon [Symbiobacteriaceae bacterium]
MSLRIITPEATLMQGVQTDAVVVPVVEGQLGILYNHAPMVSTLGLGVLRYKQGAQSKKIAINGGFLELSKNQITILADSAEEADTIDIARAKEAKARAEKRLRERHANFDRVRAEAALRRAMNRLKAAGIEE